MTDLLTKVKPYLSSEKLALVESAYAFAEECHKDQKRASGESFIQHPLQTALLLADFHLDASTLAAALLHDVREDCGVAHEVLREKFGDEVARLVDGVTKLTKMEMISAGKKFVPTHDGHDEGQAESLRKMLVAMAEDVRVVLIKLADRLHNMQTLDALPQARRAVIAQETLDIFAPLAHRLGMWDIKWRLEDLAFRHLQPEKYREISRLLVDKREEREKYITKVLDILQTELAKAGTSAEVTGRPKHIYSIFKKMNKYAAQGKEFGQIYDLFAVRVLVKELQDCYGALGVVHSLWHPLPGQFDDYIANPKENLYQSLHTTVRCLEGVPLEIQIRTYKMHQIADYGVAAHWRYKEGSTKDMRFEEKMTWLRQLLEWQRDVSEAEEFVESVKTDIFRDQVFVYTPRGEVKELPAGSTPLDFAYRIHTDLGHRCIGAKVNGKLVALDYQLKNGDTIEILATKVARGPSLDWLNTHLGYVKTANAREKIRQWFRKQAQGANIQRGRELLHKELRRLNVSMEEADVARLFKVESAEEFLAALGSGGISTSQVAARLTAQSERTQLETPATMPLVGPTSGVEVLGVGDLLTRVARCCSPLPGDEIIGFITRTRGVTVHRRDCRNLVHEDEKERLVKVEWGRMKQLYPVRIGIEAYDRVGLLRDITTTLSAEGVNIASVVTEEHEDNTASIYLTVHTTGIDQLSRIFSKVEAVKGIVSVSRSMSLGDGAGHLDSIAKK